jgi:pimeloyl-ACP methyl ester carboxylesterase
MNPKQVPIRSARSALSDRTLNVVDEGEGQTILFIHGFPLDHTFWRLQFELANRFRNIVPDLAGFGESNRPDGQLSLGSCRILWAIDGWLYRLAILETPP